MFQHYINEKERTVVAVCANCEEVAIERIIKRHPHLKKAKKGDKYRHGLERALIEKKYSAKAVCHPDDEWNEQEGIRIANEKLTAKLNKATESAVTRWVNYQYSILGRI